MFYATHTLHLPQCDALKLHVAEVVNGVVVSIFPFDGERQSMLWVDEIFASHMPRACVYGEIKNEVARDGQPLYLYSAVGGSALSDETPLLLLK